MKVRVELDIKDCRHCPFTYDVYEQGYSGTDCTKVGYPYATIPSKGFRPDCPFLKEQEKTENE